MGLRLRTWLRTMLSDKQTEQSIPYNFQSLVFVTPNFVLIAFGSNQNVLSSLTLSAFQLSSFCFQNEH